MISNFTRTRNLFVQILTKSFLLVCLFAILNSETKAQNLTRTANFSPVVMPQYMASGTATRLPVVYRATLSNLTANTTYRYFTNLCTTNTLGGGTADIGTTNSGAGNPIFIDSTGAITFATTSTTSLTTVGGYSTFTTNASGSYTGWFGVVNTGNARFTAGNNVIPTIVIGNNTTGTALNRWAFLNDSIRVLGFNAASGVNNGSFIQYAANSGATAKNFVALYDNVSGTSVAKPLSIALVESIGVSLGTIGTQIITGYSTTGGAFNAIMPNGASGFSLRRVEQIDHKTGNVMCAAVNASGYVSSATGTGATAIALSSSNFSLSSVTPSVTTAITTGSQTSCTGTAITITATPTNAGTSPSYQWKLNSANVGTNSTTYTNSNPANNSSVFVVLTPGTNVCASNIVPQSTPTTLTVNATVVPSVAISVDDNTPAIGQTINFNVASTSNSGSTPTYQWFKNNALISGATNSSYSISTNYTTGDSFFVRMTSNATCPTPATVQSPAIYITIDATACTGTPPTANAVASAVSVCNGGSTNLSLTALGGGSGYSYQWQSAATQNGTYTSINIATNATFTATNITTATWYRCVVTCDAFNVSTASNPVQVSVVAFVTPSVNISSSANPVCSGTNVSLVATPINGGSNPTYVWYRNNTIVNGQTTATYASNAFVDGEVVYAVLTSNFLCLNTATATSNSVTQNITSNVTPSVSIISSANPACAAASITFTATPTNGGNNPSYQWYNGATPISGATSSTYTTSTLANNAVISVQLTSDITCVTSATATSNSITQTITANVTPSVSITSSNNPICISGSTTFTATPTNGGLTPSYTWFSNGNITFGQNNSTYTLNSVSNNDSVYAVLSTSVACYTSLTANSNGIKQAVVSPTAATISISANPGTSINLGSNITFTATTTFAGTTPAYQWKVNGTNVGTNSATYSSTNLSNSDVVSCVLTSNYTCLSGSATVTSNALTITVIAGVPFTPGNIVVYRSGDGASTLVNTGNAVYLDEYTQNGALVQSARLTKTNTSASNLSIVSSGTASSEGSLALNTNGTNIAVPGYYSYQGYSVSGTPTSLTGTASATVNRVAALVDMNQNVDTTTRLSDWSTGNNPRGIVANGNNIYVVGGAGGVRYAVKGSTTSTQLSTTTTNLRVVNVYNGQLYVSSSSGTTRLATVGTGIPTSGTANAITNLSGTDIPALSSPYNYYFASATVLYVTDDINKSTTIRKYVFNSGNWTAAGTLALDTAARGLTGYVNNGNVTLFASTGGSIATGGMNAIYRITEALGTSNITSAYTKIVNIASANNFIAFRGICFAPTSIVTHPTNKTVCVGSTTTFNVVMASGANAIYAYQWQTSTNSGSTWNNISNGTVYNNATTATLTVLDPTGLNNNQYRCVVTYMNNSTLISNGATLTVPFTVTPSVSIATTTTNVCSGDAVTFSATGVNAGSSPIYQWKNNGVNAGTGSSIIFAPNSLTNGAAITCVLTSNNVCQTTATSTSNVLNMNVKTSPTVSPITNGYTAIVGSLIYCNFGVQIPFYALPVGGTWSTSDPTVVSLNNGTTTTGLSSSGTVNALKNGTATISYTIPSTQQGNSCTSTSSTIIIVAQETTPASIVGVSSICVGNNTTFSTASTGGVWSSTGRASINATSGAATAQSGGTTTISYTTTNSNGCKASATKILTVNALPAAPSIGYAPGTINPQAGCTGGAFGKNKTFTLVSSLTPGTWSATGQITITSLGVATTSNTNGTGSITYTHTNANGCVSSRTITGSVGNCSNKGISSQQSTVENSQFTIFPNPAVNNVNIKLQNVASGSIILTDMYGKTISTQMVVIGNNTIDVSKIAKGTYFVTLITDQKRDTKKLIVE